MKIKIEYRYKITDLYPYKAMVWLYGENFNGSSETSFEDAKEDLLKNIKRNKANVKLPEPEEIEI